jgi:hypothetical protein
MPSATFDFFLRAFDAAGRSRDAASNRPTARARVEEDDAPRGVRVPAGRDPGGECEHTSSRMTVAGPRLVGMRYGAERRAGCVQGPFRPDRNAAAEAGPHRLLSPKAAAEAGPNRPSSPRTAAKPGPNRPSSPRTAAKPGPNRPSSPSTGVEAGRDRLFQPKSGTRPRQHPQGEMARHVPARRISQDARSAARTAAETIAQRTI